MAKRLTFVTGNKNKLEEVKKILGGQGGIGIYEELVNRSVDLPELQAATNKEITIQKCEEAFKEVQGPVIVEDTGLHFKAMHDLPVESDTHCIPQTPINFTCFFPGPYIKWFLEKLGPEGLYQSLIGFNNFAAEASCCVAIKEAADKEVKVFEGRTAGTIVQARGPRTFGWDPCFEPEGFKETYAELSKEVKNGISHRYKAFAMLKEYLQEQKKGQE